MEYVCVDVETTGLDSVNDEIVEELEAPKPKVQPQPTATQKSVLVDMGGTTGELGDLPWEREAVAKPKDDVASAFDDLFNN